MIPYLVVLGSVVMVARMGRLTNNRFLCGISFGVVALILVAFAGLRDRAVGTDTSNYILFHFERATELAFITGTTEVGFNFLTWVSRTASDSYVALLLIIATIVVGVYLYTIRRLVLRYELAIFIFVCLGVYTFFFNGARQGIAAAICFAALPFLLERRALPYVLTVAVAALFHHTALVALPLYYLTSRRLDITRLLLLAVATLVLILFLDAIVALATDLLRDQYATYAQRREERGGVAFALFLIVQGVIFYLLRYKMGALKENYTVLVNIYFLGLIPVVIAVLSSVNPSGILRFHIYFSSVAILLWPMIFHQIRDPYQRAVTGLAFILFMVTFFTLTTSSFSNLTPYMLNQEILYGWLG